VPHVFRLMAVLMVIPPVPVKLPDVCVACVTLDFLSALLGLALLVLFVFLHKHRMLCAQVLVTLIPTHAQHQLVCFLCIVLRVLVAELVPFARLDFTSPLLENAVNALVLTDVLFLIPLVPVSILELHVACVTLDFS